METRVACMILGGAALLLASAAAPALDFTLGAGPLQACAGGKVGVRAAVVGYLEPAPLLQAEDYGGRHLDPENGDNVGVAHGQADLTARAGRFCVGVFYRTDYRGEASGDALDALAANHQRRPFDVGRAYSLEVDSTYLESAGLKVSRVFDIEPAAGWSLRLGVSGSLMQAVTYQQEILRGSAVATSGRYAIGTATLVRTRNEVRKRDFNPFVKRAKPEGYGYAADVGLLVRSPSGTVLELTVMDAWSTVDWTGVPESRSAIDNQTLRFDANLNREAFIQGVDQRVRVEHAFDPRYRVALGVPTQQGFTVLASDDYVQGMHFPALGVGYDDSEGERSAEVSVDLRTHALSLKARKGAFGLSLTADSLEADRATVLGVELQFARRW